MVNDGDEWTVAKQTEALSMANKKRREEKWSAYLIA